VPQGAFHAEGVFATHPLQIKPARDSLSAFSAIRVRTTSARYFASVEGLGTTNGPRLPLHEMETLDQAG
jgi:hypothetical protein